MGIHAFIAAIGKVLKHVFSYLVGYDRRYRPSVELYPDIISAKTSDDLFPKTRGFLYNDIAVCIGCGDCIKACPVRALGMDANTRVDGTVDVRRFTIDLGRCYGCSLCVDVCPVSSIKHTTNFEMAATSTNQMILEMTHEKEGALVLSGKQRDLRKFRSYEVRR